MYDMQDLSEVLSQLKDIHDPAPIGWWPPPIGWWLAGLAVIVLAVFAIFYRYKRRSALKRLAKIEYQSIVRDFRIHHDKQRLISEISMFLRRVALKNHAKEMAGTTGAEWIDFLNGLSGENIFAGQYSDLLLKGPYQSSVDFDEKAILSDIEKWVGKLK
jgi:hypothetical protein